MESPAIKQDGINQPVDSAGSLIRPMLLVSFDGSTMNVLLHQVLVQPKRYSGVLQQMSAVL